MALTRSSVFQQIQYGIEGAGTPGTVAAASVRLIETYIAPKPMTAIKAYRPAGAEVATAVTRGKEYTEAQIEGALSYTEIEPLLRSLLTNAGGKTFKPAMWSAPAVDTLTVECGNSVRCERFSYGVVSGLRFRFTKEEAALTGTMIGRTLTEGVTQTGGVNPLTKATVNPDLVQVKIGDSVGGLADVDEFLEAELNISGRYTPVFALDSGNTSFTNVAAKAPDLTAQLIIPHEATAAGYMADLRTAATKICRIYVAETIGGVGYSLQITFPFAFEENDRADNDGVWASTYNLKPIWDSTFAGWLEIVIDNT